MLKAKRLAELPTAEDILGALEVEARAKRMTVHEALSRAFVCGLNAAVHAAQDREAAESGEFLAAVERMRAG